MSHTFESMTPLPSERNRVIYSSIIARYWQDQEFADRLRADPTKTCIDEGIILPDNLTLEVRFNTTDETFVIFPFENYDAAIEQFHEALKVLLPLPQNHSLTVIQNTEFVNYIVLPLPPPSSVGVELMTDEDLANIAAGGAVEINTAVAVNAVAAVNALGYTNAVAATMGVVAAAAVGVCVLVLYPFNIPEFLVKQPSQKLRLS